MSRHKFEKKYNNIYIIDSFSNWDNLNINYSVDNDLVLTYDLAFIKHIELLNGNVFYIDHLVDADTLQLNNFIIYDFFNTWHINSKNKDIFIYKNVPFGFSFRLDFWNDYVSYVRLYLSLSTIKELEYKRIFLQFKSDMIVNVLNDLNFNYKVLPLNTKGNTSYYFPIDKWLDEKIRPSGFRGFLVKTRAFVTKIYGIFVPYIDNIVGNTNKKTILIQEYHPTREIIKNLRNDSKLKILLENFSRDSKFRDNLKERLLPIVGSLEEYEDKSSAILSSFKKEKHHKLVLSSGDDISKAIYKILEQRIANSIARKLRIIDSSISYIDKYSVDMEILIANIGEVVTIFDCVCKSKGIPSYLIINGLMGPEYYDDSKYATVINGYSESIKNNYFRGMDNIVTLGDPRMDMYPPSMKLNTINRDLPTITIGASGFNSCDLNSYVAVEFDFMYDILTAFQTIKENGIKFHINIKVRGNGYKSQYVEFVAKYFKDLDVNIEDTIPMKKILEQTDLYISIYSQTLFEASCMGIPTIYYKKDTEIMDPPFDCKSELVTILNTNDLIQAFYDFRNKHERYNAFLDRKVMEKYIGPLDGKNLERNIDFIYELLDKGYENV